MSALVTPPAAPPRPRLITVDEYHRMIKAGFFDQDERTELIEGKLVQDMARDPIHNGTIRKVFARLGRVLPAGWIVDRQDSITLADSEPEPDVAIVRANPDGYLTRHPGVADVGLLVEVSYSTLAYDRTIKQRIYARAGVPVYWIINLIDNVVEEHTMPDGLVAYGVRRECRAGDELPVVLDGITVATIDAADLLLSPSAE